MKESEKQILEDILESRGDCLHWSKCQRCPFADVCLTNRVAQDSHLSRKERLNLALERLANYYLLEDEETRLDYENS